MAEGELFEHVRADVEDFAATAGEQGKGRPGVGTFAQFVADEDFERMHSRRNRPGEFPRPSMRMRRSARRCFASRRRTASFTRGFCRLVMMDMP